MNHTKNPPLQIRSGGFGVISGKAACSGRKRRLLRYWAGRVSTFPARHRPRMWAGIRLLRVPSRNRRRRCFRYPGLAHPLLNRLHQILKIGENVGVGLVTVLRHHVAVNDHVEFSMWAGGEFEGADVLPHPAQRFSCHPGSTEGVASIPAIENFQFHLFVSRHIFLPAAPMTA